MIYIIFLISKNKNNSTLQSKCQTNDGATHTTYQTPPTYERKSNTTSKKSTAKKRQVRKTKRMKWRNKMLDISMIPQTVELDKDTLLPQTLNRQYGYGKRFNVFITENCSYYHKSKCAKIKGQKKQCIHRYIALYKIKPCSDCIPLNYIDEWYIEFLEKNFDKFTTYYEFQKWVELPNVKLPNDKRSYIDIEENNK